jgi:RNA polymerase sigma-70 factor (ECF subfamily)
MASRSSNARSAPAGRFATTHWSIIAAAQDGSSPKARAALAALCSAYWYPLYVFIRGHVEAPDEAQDLTQGFFTSLLEKKALAVADRSRGKFRSFLLGTCKHYLSHERGRARAQKRGGGRKTVSLDFDDAEARYAREPTHTVAPDKLFARRWAMTLLDQVLYRLREEFAAKGKQALFDHLRVCLLGDNSALPHAQVALELGMSEGSVKVAAHRLRGRFRDLVREEITRTVDRPEDVEDEIRELFAALAT